MYCWPFSCFKQTEVLPEAFEIECKMADHVAFANRVRKSLYYGEYSDASLPSLSVTDVAVEVLNSAVPPRQRLLDRKYAHSVARRAKISPCALMMGMLYAERLRQRDSQCTKTLSSSEMFLISIMVASKYLYDEGEEEEVYNEDWAKAGSKTVQDINKLEIEFLRMMDWNLFISKDEFSNFVSQVESRVAITKGLSRGWLTYRDMSILLENENLLKKLLEIHQQLLKSISTCLAAYILGVSILLGSSSLATLDHNQGTPSSVHTAANPTFNCLTTEALCVFSRTPIVADGPQFEFRPIAARRARSNPRYLVQGLSKPTITRENTALTKSRNSEIQSRNPIRFSTRKFHGLENRNFFKSSGSIKDTDRPTSYENITSVDVYVKLLNDTRNLPGTSSVKTSFSCVFNSNQSASCMLERGGLLRSDKVFAPSGSVFSSCKSLGFHILSKRGTLCWIT